MTNTTRDLIQRMATELDLYRQMVLDDCTSTHPLADEARATLSQPEPEPPTQASIALQMLDAIEHDSLYPPEVTAPIRRALERLQELEGEQSPRS